MLTKNFALAAAKNVGTKYKLAKIVGVSHATVYGWTHGKHEAAAKHLHQLMQLAQGARYDGVARVPAILAHKHWKAAKTPK